MWGRTDLGDRIAQLMVAAAAFLALGNGAFMLVDPLGWYDAVGTVRATGPANAHFLRDIGLAYLFSAALLGHAAVNLGLRWGTALAGATWLLLHGLLHVWEVSRGICSPGIFWREAPGTLGIPLLALAGVAIRMVRMRIAAAPLPARVFIPLADRMTQGLSPYWNDLAAAPGFLVEKYQHFMALSQHRHAAPRDLVAMARFGALRAEDCGPCSLIAAHGALREGMDRKLVNAALAVRPPEGELADAFGFGRAVAANDAVAAAELGDRIEGRHGRATRTELAVAAASARVFPALKRGLGLAQSCPITPPQV